MLNLDPVKITEEDYIDLFLSAIEEKSGGRRPPTYYGTIAGLCADFAENAKHALEKIDLSREEKTKRCIEATYVFMRRLEDVAQKLFEDPPKIEKARNGEVKLTEEGKRTLQEFHKPKTDPM